MVDKPSSKEEEFFKQQEFEKIKRMREQAAVETELEEKNRLKEMHWMRCPKCGLELSEIDFRGVEVDACFACGGMFFDHGEIDKIVAAEDDPGLLGKMVSTLFGK